VPGNEGAGVVIEDPSGRFSAGERVLFFAGPGGVAEDGTYAEMTSVPSGNLAALPGEIPDEIAGGLPVAYLSAFLALRRPAFARGNRFWRRASAEASAMRRSRWPVRSERRSWCQRQEARRRSPLPPPTADCTRSTSSTSSVSSESNHLAKIHTSPCSQAARSSQSAAQVTRASVHFSIARHPPPDCAQLHLAVRYQE